MNSPSAGKTGYQHPRIESYPLYATSAGDDAIDLSAAAGLILDPWQEHVLRQSLGEKPGGGWEAFEVGLVVPRQNGKGSVLEARELAGLFLFGEKSIVHTAHLFSTATEHRARMETLIFDSPLKEYLYGYEGQTDPRKVPGIRTGGSDISITLSNGNKLRFLARSGGSGRGFSGDLVVLDEAYDLPDATLAALMPTMAARSAKGAPQIWYTSSAGMVWSDVLARVRERGIKKEPGLAYFEWSAEETDPPESPESWAKANPAMGLRISEDFIRTEFSSLDIQDFLRERLGVWDNTLGDQLIPPTVWEGLIDPEMEHNDDTLCLGIDVSPDLTSASMAVASKTPDGKITVEVVENRPGTDWLSSRVEDFIRVWSPRSVLVEGGSQCPAALQDSRLVMRKIKTVSAEEYKRSCGAFYSEVKNKNLAHSGQDVLAYAVDAAKKSSVKGDLWKWSRVDAKESISPLVAATLAVSGARLVRGSRRVSSFM